MEIIVGGIIENQGKILMVQEGKEKCYGKWSIPAGHLETNETIMEGALREIKEETGCDVELTGIATVANKVLEDNVVVFIIFVAKLLNETIKIDSKEILNVKWFEINEILNNMDSELRDISIAKQPIKNMLENKIGTLDIINVI
ncbi:MAG: NUDIX hydrolase [Clostridia bacterium]|nr:NUDIX hydrolase [Clostridia bacterium]